MVINVGAVSVALFSSERATKFVTRLNENLFHSMNIDNHPSEAYKSPIFCVCDMPRAMSLTICILTHSLSSLIYNLNSTVYHHLPE